MTAYEGALASTLGGPDAKTGSEGHTARRVNIVTPFNRIVDDTVDACAITDRFFPKFADLEHNDRNNVFTLLISYAANRICRKLKIDPKNVKLFHDELAALVSLNESSTRTVIKAQFNAQSKHRDIPVTPSAPNIPFTAKLVNVVPIKRLLKKVGTPPPPAAVLHQHLITPLSFSRPRTTARPSPPPGTSPRHSRASTPRPGCLRAPTAVSGLSASTPSSSRRSRSTPPTRPTTPCSTASSPASAR